MSNSEQLKAIVGAGVWVIGSGLVLIELLERLKKKGAEHGRSRNSL